MSIAPNQYHLRINIGLFEPMCRSAQGSFLPKNLILIEYKL
ncbi:Uncharacterised protein [Legionella steigerwaltii]|uniref:Uncharacterized protein n=1 Tax=Legionella steigerwaltii TaxID=460 RepID=A0A378L9W8_9GAMM|nr:Uncharacterised protein [Legionella steigerwaltii]